MQPRDRGIGQSQHGLGRVELQVDFDFAGAAVEVGLGRRRRVMRVDHRREYTQRRAARDLRRWKIVGRADQQPGHVRPGTRSTIGHPRRHAVADQLQLAGAVKFTQQHEGLAAADEDAIGASQQRLGARRVVPVQGFRRRHSDVGEGLLQPLLHAVALRGQARVQDEGYLLAAGVVPAHHVKRAVGKMIAVHHAAPADQHRGRGRERNQGN
jgi:hypothetical protein